MIVLSGFVGTSSMTIFLWLITAYGISNVDMVRALGSSITHDESNAFLPGLLVHYSAGLMFSFLYVFIFNIIPELSRYLFGYIMAGGLLGFVHGLVFALLLMIVVAEHHPLAKYKKAGFGVATYHFLGHIIYGLTLGLIYAVGQALI